jgi:hypothetical protein
MTALESQSCGRAVLLYVGIRKYFVRLEIPGFDVPNRFSDLQ